MQIANCGSISRYSRGRVILATLAVVASGQLAHAELMSSTPGQFSGISRVSDSLISTPPSGIGDLLVTPGDTFNIVIVGFTNNGNGALVTAPVDPVFGTTTTYTGAALGGQVLTVTSNESIGATTTTDTITISVPTNFVPAGTTIGGNPINDLTLEIGEFNAGPDPVNFLLPIDPSTLTDTASIAYGTNSTFSFNPLPGVVLLNGNSAFAATGGVGVGTTGDISTTAVHAFTLSVTYATVAVPEPASIGLLASLGAGALLRRRTRTTHA